MKKNIINVSDFSPQWHWLESEFKNKNLDWVHYSSQNIIHSFIPKHSAIGRSYCALKSTLKAKKSASVLVSHGPTPTSYVGLLAEKICPETPHLAFSFNFTELPQGKKRDLMASAYQQPTRFVCYSTFEQNLYAEYFGIPLSSIDMIYWSQTEVATEVNEQATESGRYICALGTQGRDYQSLFSAMKKLPNIKLVAVVSPAYIEGLVIPENVIIRNNIPLSQAFNILKFSEFMVLPLRNSQIPCGHSTIVSSMFFKKTILISNAITVSDYITDGVTGLFFEPSNPQDLKQKIESLWEDQKNTHLMNATAYQFAKTHCTEQSAVQYFSKFLKNYA